jgi:zinc transport system substrate-binding protein
MIVMTVRGRRVAGRWRRRLLPVLALLLGATVLTGCRPDHHRGVEVVASFYPLQFVAQRVAGGHAHVVNLTRPGKEPHDLELTVWQTGSLADADVVLYERGLQPAVDDAVDSTEPHSVVDAAAVTGLVDDTHGNPDPHFWQDPTRLSAVAAAFEAKLADADPRHASVYRHNLRRLQGQLAALDRSYRRGLASCRIHTIVVSHDAFGYLGRRYGLRVVGINGLSPDAEPSPAHIRQLQDLSRRDGITTVFTERLDSAQLADSLAGDLHIRTAVLDPIEGLTDQTADQSYLSLMRQNLAALRKADDCT